MPKLANSIFVFTECSAVFFRALEDVFGKPVFHSSSLYPNHWDTLVLFIFQSTPSGHSSVAISCQKRIHFPKDMYIHHTYLEDSRFLRQRNRDTNPFKLNLFHVLSPWKKTVCLGFFSFHRMNKQTASVVLGH